MGYVYSPRQVNKGEVPAKHDFGVAYDMLKEGLNKAYFLGHIVGAEIHGGYADSREDIIGSDIDVLAVTNSVEAFRWISENIYAPVWNSKFVPVEPGPYLMKNAYNGMHHAERFFCERLRGGGVIIGEDPTSFFKQVDTIPDGHVIKQDFDTRIQKLGRMRSQIKELNDEEHCKLLECLIRWPIYTALDMLRLKEGASLNEREKLLKKSEICEKYREEFPQIDSGRLFKSLEMRKRYRGMINNPPVNMPDYLKLLSDIDSSLEDAYGFITDNGLLLLEQMKKVS